MEFVARRRNVWVGAIALVVVAARCGGGPSTVKSQLAATVHLSGDPADVANVEVDVVDAKKSCGTPPLTSATLPIGPSGRDAALQSSYTANVTFTLSPGAYRICATPLMASGAHSASIAPTEITATIGAGVTASVDLFLGSEPPDGGAPDTSDGSSDAADATGGGAGDAGGGSGGGGAGGGGGDAAAGRGGGGAGGSATPGDDCEAAAGGAGGSRAAGGSGGTADISVVCPGYRLTGDFDGDGIQDCVIADTATIAFHKGAGGGMFQTDAVISPVLIRVQVFAVATDLDGDGRDDILFMNDFATNLVNVVRGRPDGTFRRCPHNNGFDDFFPNGLRTIGAGEFGGGFIYAVGDVTGDGRNDVLTIGRTTDTSIPDFARWIVFSRPSGTDHLRITVSDEGVRTGSTGWMNGLAVADVDGDGRLDATVSLLVRGLSEPLSTVPQTVVGYGSGTGTFSCHAGDSIACPTPKQWGECRSPCASDGKFDPACAICNIDAGAGQ